MAVRTVRRVTDKGKEPVRDKPSHEWTPEEPPKKPRKPRKDIGQKRKKRNTQAQQDEQEEQDGAVGEGAPGPATDNASNEWRPEPPPKKARKPRKDKGQKRKKPDSEEQQGEEGIEGEAGPAERGTQAKRRRVTKKGTEPLANGAEAEQEEGEGGDQDRPARRRGRERATTPEDAETHVLDPKETTMDQLASRNFRTGRISKREQQMREINWEEVEQRRREANKRKENVLLTRAEVQAQLAEAAEARAQAQEQRQQRRTRTELVNGQIVLVEEQADDDDIIDGDAEDAANIVEEGDLTVRITTKSFMRANKKFPDELMLPGQAPRWTNELTDRFYDGLRMFGTDFSMISTLFEHSTRRSMKLKFNREEREHPERVKEALNKQRDSNWEEYITKRGIKGDPKDYFADVEEIKRDLEAQKEAMQVEIDAAKAAAEEERRQRRIAGVLSEDENADPKEDGRKKRKKKNKGVSWMEEEGVEILGEGEGEDDW
jgi:transcription factor TFIIIB component B''